MASKPSVTQGPEHTLERYVSWAEYEDLLMSLKDLIVHDHAPYVDSIYGISRGGLVPAVHLSHLLGVPLVTLEPKEDIESLSRNVLVVDDISDSGAALSPFDEAFYTTATLFLKPHSTTPPTFHTKVVSNNTWVVFPWEGYCNER